MELLELEVLSWFSVLFSAGSLILCLTFAFLYKRDKNRYLIFWSLSWGVLFVGYFVFNLSFQYPMVPLILVLYVGIIGGAYFFYHASRIFLELPDIAAWKYVAALVILSVIVLSYFENLFFLGPYIVFGLAGLLYFASAFLFLKIKEINHLWTGRVVLLFGIVNLTYPLGINVDWYAPGGYLTTTIFALAVALATAGLHLQRIYSIMNEDNIQIQQKHDYMRRIFDTMNQYIFICNPHDYRIEFLNRAAREDFGNQVGELCYTQAGKDEPCDNCPIPSLMSSDAPEQVKYSFEAYNRIFEGKAGKLVNPDGSVSVLEVLDDVTEQKQMEEMIEFERSRLFSIFDSINEIIYISDPRTYEILYTNKYTEKLFGKKLEGKICYEELQHKDAPCEFCTNENILQNKGVPFQWEFFNPVVEKYYFITDRIIKWPDGRDVRFELAIDITKHKESEEALKESERKYREILETMEEGYYEVDLAGNFVFFNDSLCKIAGYTREEFSRLSYKEIYKDPEEVFSVYTRVYNTGEPEKAAGWSILTKDGNEVFVEVSITIRRDNDGEPIGFRGIARDITERKEAEQALQESEGKFRALAESSPTAIMMFQNDYWVYANRAAEEISGYAKEELYEMRFWEIVHPDFQPVVMERGRKRQQGEEVTPSYEFKIVTKQGEERWVSLTGATSYYQGVEAGFVNILDITEHKEAEEALRKSEEKYRTILYTMEEGYYEVDLAGNFTFFNDSLCKLVDYSSEELMRLGYKNIYKNPDEVFEVYNRVYRTGESEKAVGWPVIAKDGSELFLEVSITLMRDSEGNPTGFRGIVRDITERKQAEEALQESEEKFRTLAENSPTAIMMYQNDYWVYANAAAETITGYTREELYNMCFWEINHPDYHEVTKERGRKRQEGEYVTPNYELKIVTKQGEERWVSLTGATSTFEGVPAGFVTLMDITARKEAEEALRKSEEKYREILTTMEEGYYEVDLAGTIINLNQSAAHMMGYELDELMETNFKEISKDPMTVYSQFNQVFKTGKPAYAMTLEMLRKDGSVGYGEFSVTPVRDKEGYISGFRGIVRDITERIQYEEQLRYLSFHDQLTGLYNRAYFENEIDRLSKSREYPITIVSVDLDGLKLANDTLGHAQGDELLKGCADVLKEIFRSSDIISRVGGDEFAVILPRTDRDTGQKIVNRIYKTLENFNRRQKHKLPLHVSLGLATTHGRSKSLEETFKEADDLMYQDKSQKGVSARPQMIKALVSLLGEKDFLSTGHIQRLEELCSKLGKELGLSEQQISNLKLLAQMHDIGKISIEDSILLKEEPLTNEEWETIKQHAEKGYRIALSSLDLAEIAELILKHHERWDGKGYPLGVKEEEIPLEARIFAVVDAYEAMTNDRPYRKAMSKNEAVEELHRYVGTQFDPYVVDVFLALLKKGIDAGKQS